MAGGTETPMRTHPTLVVVSVMFLGALAVLLMLRA